MKPADLARAAFAEVLSNDEPDAIAVAPGRVNLIGEHTDYQNGFVLPMAIDRNVAVAFRPRADGVLQVHSVEYGETRTARISELRAPGGSAWFDFVAAVPWALREAGAIVSGADLAIAGDVPVGAGLSSSAALEVAVARAICSASAIEWERVRMATLCQQAENQYVGVSCGIMDQFAASVCVDGAALLLDCASLEFSLVPVPPEAGVVVMDTGVRRSLAVSEYNDRRSSCETAVAEIARSNPSVSFLRDVDRGLLEEVRGSVDEETFRRATHVVDEIRRPAQMADALQAADLNLAGRLMNESHVSLRDLYEVSCTELDLITAIAREHEACYGARMTGAGFGGCAVALVARERAELFMSDVAEVYSATGVTGGAMYECRPASGATIV